MGAPSTQALERTLLARVRTAVALILTCAIVARGALDVRPAAALVCFVVAVAAVATRTTRRGGVVNYADPGSGDEFPDAGALDSDDSDFGGAGGGGKQGGRSTRLSSRAPAGSAVFDAGRGAGSGYATPVQAQQSNELDRSYLGEIPPARFITARPLLPTRLEY